jgi:amino acid transporter
MLTRHRTSRRRWPIPHHRAPAHTLATLACRAGKALHDAPPGSSSRLGFNATWSTAVGGMVGGGIFSTLGLAIAIAGPLAWLSFVAAGLVELAAGHSYVKLAPHYGEGGGAFTFLREIDEDGLAGSLSGVLIVGYVLTNSVYAFTFGQYLGQVVVLEPWFPRATGVAIIALFTGPTPSRSRSMPCSCCPPWGARD